MARPKYEEHIRKAITEFDLFVERIKNSTGIKRLIEDKDRIERERDYYLDKLQELQQLSEDSAFPLGSDVENFITMAIREVDKIHESKEEK